MIKITILHRILTLRYRNLIIHRDQRSWSRSRCSGNLVFQSVGVFSFQVKTIVELIKFRQYIQDTSANIDLTIAEIFPAFRIFNALTVKDISKSPVQGTTGSNAGDVGFCDIICVYLESSISLEAFYKSIGVFCIFIPRICIGRTGQGSIKITVHSIKQGQLQVVRVDTGRVEQNIHGTGTIT